MQDNKRDNFTFYVFLSIWTLIAILIILALTCGCTTTKPSVTGGVTGDFNAGNFRAGQQSGTPDGATGADRAGVSGRGGKLALLPWAGSRPSTGYNREPIHTPVDSGLSSSVHSGVCVGSVLLHRRDGMSFWTVLIAAFLGSLMSATVRKVLDWFVTKAKTAAETYKRGKTANA